jgi:transposase
MIRVLRVARAGATKARTQAINALRSLVVTAAPELRDQLKGLSSPALIKTAAGLRSGPLNSTTAATKAALRSAARRAQALDAELAELDAAQEQLVAEVSPELINLFAVGTQSAAALLVSAGDNPDRLTSEAAAARLWGVAPRECSSGQTIRHRVNRGGDRQANAALYRIVIVRMRWHPATREYVDRRTSEGKSKKEIIRCLKRYVAREVYTALVAGNPNLRSQAA